MADSGRATSSDEITHVEHDARNHSMAQERRGSALDAKEKLRSNTNAKLANPLAYESPEELRQKGRAYAKKHFIGDEEDIRAFEIGACLAQDPKKWDKVQGLRPEERAVLEKETMSRWAQPKLMYLVIGRSGHPPTKGYSANMRKLFALFAPPCREWTKRWSTAPRSSTSHSSASQILRTSVKSG